MGLQWKDRLAFQENDSGILLFREGIFARIYEEGAWRFIKQVRPLKVSVRRIKKLDRNVVYCGLPISALSALGVDLDALDPEKECWRLEARQMDAQAFLEWRRLQQKARPDRASERAREAPPAADGAHGQDWVRRIAAIDLLSLSPMEAWSCLNGLRQEACLTLGLESAPRKGGEVVEA